MKSPRWEYYIKFTFDLVKVIWTDIQYPCGLLKWYTCTPNSVLSTFSQVIFLMVLSEASPYTAQF